MALYRAVVRDGHGDVAVAFSADRATLEHQMDREDVVLALDVVESSKRPDPPPFRWLQKLGVKPGTLVRVYLFD